jgi:NTP pyrophosphatase (non-canonical NTP hydrolase)
MELEKIINDTQDFMNRVHAIEPQWLEDPSTLVVELSRVVGILAESTLVTEGKRPARPVRLAHNVADVLFMLMSISNYYHIDLEKVWNEWVPQTRTHLYDDEFIKAVRARLATARQQKMIQ